MVNDTKFHFTKPVSATRQPKQEDCHYVSFHRIRWEIPSIQPQEFWLFDQSSACLIYSVPSLAQWQPAAGFVYHRWSLPASIYPRGGLSDGPVHKFPPVIPFIWKRRGYFACLGLPSKRKKKLKTNEKAPKTEFISNTAQSGDIF